MWDAPSLIVIDDLCNLLCLAVVLSIVEVSFKLADCLYNSTAGRNAGCAREPLHHPHQGL